MSAPTLSVATPLSFGDRLTVWGWRYILTPLIALIGGSSAPRGRVVERRYGTWPDETLDVIAPAPAAERFRVEGFRRMPGWRKLQRVVELIALTRSLALADIRRCHPDADERELRLRLAARRLDPALLRDHFGWSVEREGF